MKSYKATRDINLGGSNALIRKGMDIQTNEIDLIIIEGKERRLIGISGLIQKGWITQRAEKEVQPVVYHPEAVVSKEVRALSGKAPKADQGHAWDTGPSDWGTSDKTCKVCGCTQVDVMRVDRRLGNGKQQFHYRDVHNNLISSPSELGCPVYLGDANSAAAVAKDQVRKVKGRVDNVESYLENAEIRIQLLEQDALFLRERLLTVQPVITAEVLANALEILAQRKALGESLDPLPLTIEASDLLDLKNPLLSKS